jgi:hypothetical protein
MYQCIAYHWRARYCRGRRRAFCGYGTTLDNGDYEVLFHSIVCDAALTNSTGRKHMRKRLPMNGKLVIYS